MRKLKSPHCNQTRANFNNRPPEVKTLKTAILFLVFNRPETTAQVFDAIKRARPPRLYIAADGPRKNHIDDLEKTRLVREIVTAVDWPCVVKTLFRKNNIGCNLAPKEGIDWFFEHEESGIVLEDDCLPSQSFFIFCEQMLIRYANNNAVMAVTGTNITKSINFTEDYWFSNFALMWGWASWRRAWLKYDSIMSDWPKLKHQNWLKRLGIAGKPFELTWQSIFDRTVKLGQKATWWDYQWIYTCWINGGLTVSPSLNLVKNLGFTKDATHTLGSDPYRDNLVPLEMTFPLVHPKEIKANVEADRFIAMHWFHCTWKQIIKSKLLRIPGIKSMNKMRKYLFQKP
ncbi:hypothetical protein [Hydrogenophaga taeniospiralis]|uniref:hypothetical protein n=1 Tax=Hydrogenophaga taeniospiralis TaxID=65656 RepID=UPI001CFB938A|nr:hypothetical protein [Hydrogenophaga taeniospiralis]UCU92212.1 hypothetical protein KI616_15210 [Hydrogenophaga taeniospiralis]